MKLFSDEAQRWADQDHGRWEPPADPHAGRAAAVEAEFESMIRDPGYIESAFAEGLTIDAITAGLLAALADKPITHPAYSAAAVRIEEILRRAIWREAEKAVQGRSEP